MDYLEKVKKLIRKLFVIKKEIGFLVNIKYINIMDKKEFIKNLIEINNDANDSIIALEHDAQAIKIENDKDKANFGNMCVMLRGYRMIADASEAMLFNENVLRTSDGKFYQKIEDEEETVENEQTSGDEQGNK